MSRSIVRTSFLIVLVVLALSGCKGGVREDPILRLSAEESLEKGQELMQRKKYSRAVDYLDHAFEVAPNSTTGRDALLLAADAYYLGGGTANFIKAEAKYRDFQNRFPTSDRSDYVQMQIAKCLAEQILKPDRDQEATHKALTAFESIQQLYPTSEYAAEVESRIIEIRNTLAEHEYRVGRYNYRRRILTSAIWRLEWILEKYPDFAEMDKVLYMLGMAYRKSDRHEDSVATFQRLKDEYPDSKFIKKIPQKPKKKKVKK